MRETLCPALETAGGVHLELLDYRKEFAERHRRLRGRDSWKCERRQDFVELDHPSYDAFRAGRWEESMRLLDDRRESLRETMRERSLRATVFHRVRVVEEPLTPYLQWELRSLAVQAECGAAIRVVPGGRVARFEESGPLPEVVVLGGETLYHVLYTPTGSLDGAIRIDDSAVVSSWTALIRGLYGDGEDVTAYVDRHVATLPPPRVGSGE
ncbi:DUF6879 family protein [Streptomyces radicis]|uniref:DUF6879 domain-containing protein n=1 Tax=Streptomyces radicis TaxID=1750517 RepID=A0A3A9VYI2_9ACTN|nr:DUF6879 family protein [Streptomyces radicis]RKN05203.1 hypothetical protein D7319_25865 [Streptomyces radicis]RKN16736.1 hypothetical protein D7318_25230 [Streptomyces radicis]